MAVHDGRAVDQKGGPRRGIVGPFEEMRRTRPPGRSRGPWSHRAGCRRRRAPRPGRPPPGSRRSSGRGRRGGDPPPGRPGVPWYRPPSRRRPRRRAWTAARGRRSATPRSSSRPTIPPTRYVIRAPRVIADHGSGVVAAEMPGVPRVIADGQATDHTGDDEKEAEDLHEQHIARRPGRDALARAFRGALGGVVEGPGDGCARCVLESHGEFIDRPDHALEGLSGKCRHHSWQSARAPPCQRQPQPPHLEAFTSQADPSCSPTPPPPGRRPPGSPHGLDPPSPNI